MKKPKLRMPSPALIVAMVALIVALGGASYAAVKLGKGTVTTKALKNKSVTEKKLAPAARGRAVAYGEINQDGTVGPNSRAISNANITRQGTSPPANSIYCFHDLPKHGTVAVTPGFGATEFDGIVSANLDQAPINPDSGACSSVPGTQFVVFTYYDDFFGSIAPARAPMPFFVQLFQ